MLYIFTRSKLFVRFANSFCCLKCTLKLFLFVYRINFLALTEQIFVSKMYFFFKVFFSSFICIFCQFFFVESKNCFMFVSYFNLKMCLYVFFERNFKNNILWLVDLVGFGVYGFCLHIYLYINC